MYVQIIMATSISKEQALKRINTVLYNARELTHNAIPLYEKNSSTKYIIEAGLHSQLYVSLKQTILDLSLSNSEYRKIANSISPPFSMTKISYLIGALKSLKMDYENDFLTNINEMIDAELFTDILEQAEYLLSQNYIRASAVVAGVSLESHIRKLAVKNSIPISNDGKYKNADSLNNELYKNNIIDKTYSKSVTSWLGLRNDGAHPESKEIDGKNVKLMIDGIKLFIQKYPA